MPILGYRAPRLLKGALAVGVLSWMALTGSVNWSSFYQRGYLHKLLTETRAEGGEEGEGERRLRDDWFHEQRAYPLEEIPPAARVAAIEQLEVEEARLSRLRAASFGEASLFDEMPTWVPLGPMPIVNGQTFGSPRVPVSGRVSAIALDPGYDGKSNQTVYLGAAQGGVWRSWDNGAHWTPLTDDQPSLAIGALAIDPTNPNIIYAGTGEGVVSADAYFGAGLLKSTNGGATWTQITGPVSSITPNQPAFLNAAITKIVIDPVSPSTIYLGTTVGRSYGATGGSGSAPLGQRGVWKSPDGGATWSNLDPSGSGGAVSSFSLVIDPLNHSQIFAALFAFGIYRSTASGAPGSWEKLSDGLPFSFGRIALAAGPPLAPSTNATLYAAVAATNDNLIGIFRSTDNGATWQQMTTPQLRGQANYNLALAVDPVDAQVVYYGTSANDNNDGGTLFRTKDGGLTWLDISLGNGTGGLHADHHAIAVGAGNRNVVFSGNDGGIWRSDNALDAVVGWAGLNQTLNITQFQSVALHPTNPNIILGGTQDNGTNRYDGNAAWFHSQDGDSGFTLIDQSNPQMMYHTFFNQSGFIIGPQISFDSGATWDDRLCFFCAAQPGNFNPNDRVGFYAPMALHTGFAGANGNVIYFGTHRLYRSDNQGLKWTGLGSSSDGFGADLTKGFGRLSAIAAHPKLGSGAPPSEVVWIGTSDGNVQLTANAGLLAGATFTNATKAPLPNRFVTDIALDPADQRRALVTYSGFNLSTPATPGHVFLTTDQGATWRDISSNLPDVPVTSAVIDPVLAGTYYIGTDLGVFETTDGGATWIRLARGMPKVAVFMLRYHAAARCLVAATHGRGMFRLDLGQVNPVPTLTSLSQDTGIVGDPAFKLIVNGKNFVDGSAVRWNGEGRATTFVSETVLAAEITAEDLAAAGTAQVAVFNPAPGGGVSNALSLTVAAQTVSCITVCFSSPQSYLTNQRSWPSGSIVIGGVNFNGPVNIQSNVLNIRLALQAYIGGPSALQQLNREFVAAQMSIERLGRASSGLQALNSSLSCYGLRFMPLRLSTGFTITTVTRLRDLFDQTRLAIRENRSADMMVLAGVLEALNSDDPSGRCY